MGKRKQGRIRTESDGMVFSTNPGFSWDVEEEEDEAWSVERAATLYVSLDRKQRAGKPVTLVEDFDGPAVGIARFGQASEAALRRGRLGERRVHFDPRRPP